jgi:hypothetical protein
MVAVIETRPAPLLVEVLCPICLPRGKRRVLVRAAIGSVVEAYCRDCRYRKIVTVR